MYGVFDMNKFKSIVLLNFLCVGSSQAVFSSVDLDEVNKKTFDWETAERYSVGSKIGPTLEQIFPVVGSSFGALLDDINGKKESRHVVSKITQALIEAKRTSEKARKAGTFTEHYCEQNENNIRTSLAELYKYGGSPEARNRAFAAEIKKEVIELEDGLLKFSVVCKGWFVNSLECKNIRIMINRSLEDPFDVENLNWCAERVKEMRKEIEPLLMKTKNK